eukprot:Phypoly_transcript_08396.p1 GENE.Phypoly_transcript_08396~~Phypoly_transcript_08396.p1  ORF type:complete len:457 (+),score=85.84 Phypoly_transcript_08396:110-1480(+)
MRRFLPRSVCTLTTSRRLLQPRVRNIFIPLSADTSDASHGKECTLYIKGFLAKGEHADHFEDWQRGHKVLTETHKWGSTAHGYFWKSGDLPGSLVPYATLLTGAYCLLTMKKIALTPQGLALTAAAEAVVIGGKFWYEFKKAADTAKAHGPNLAAHIEEITQQYPYVRIVAHSLGCALTLEALRHLPAKSRPHEIHFLAPVIDEDDLMHNIAKEHAYIYHCGNDFALQTASALFYQQKHVVGLAGPKKTWRGLTAIDVSHHFGFFVHTNYRNVLDKLMVDHRKVYSATSASETITAVVKESGDSEVLVSEVAEPEQALVWTPESENLILSKFEEEMMTYEKAHAAAELSGNPEVRKTAEGEEKEGIKIEEERKAEGVQALVEESVQKLGNAIKEGAESVQKLGNALKESAELLQVGKTFLQNVRVLLDNRKDLLDQAKNLAGVVLENVPLGQKKEK